jgi:exodeoxyribonuclease X
MMWWMAEAPGGMGLPGRTRVSMALVMPPPRVTGERRGHLLLGPWICSYKCALRVWPELDGHSNQELRYAPRSSKS